MAMLRPLGQFFLLCGTAVLLVLPARGGGPLYVTRTSGSPTPLAWNPSGTVTYNCDLGSLGSLSNTQAVQLVANAFQPWKNVPTSTLSIVAGSQLSKDVSASGNGPSNYKNFLDVPVDGLNPVVFDTDGTIIEALLGEGNSNYVMGYAALAARDDTSGRIVEAEAVLNGKFVNGVNGAGDPEVSQAVFRGAVTHELGHFLGLDHAQLNTTEAFDGIAANDSAVPTMFPVNVHQGGSAEGGSLHQDDIAAYSSLYPTTSFASATGVIDGRVFLPDAVTPYQGMNVIARKVDDPTVTAVSCVSGYLFRDSTDSDGTVDPSYRGYYRIAGLPPGNYTVQVEPVNRRFKQDASVGPLDPPAEFGGVGEYWNGFNEGSSPVDDLPNQRVVVPVSAAQTVSNVNFTLNYAGGIYHDASPGDANSLANTQLIFTPSPSSLGGYLVRRRTGIAGFPHATASDAAFALGDDSYVTIDYESTGLQFPVFGAPQTSLNICSNGFLTFGTPTQAAEGDPTPTVQEHFGPRPHVSAWYTDLNPGAGGSLLFGQDSGGLYITFQNVPLKAGGGSNSFQYRLAADGTVTITYLSIAATGGLTGISSGGTFSAPYATGISPASLSDDSTAPSIAIVSPVDTGSVSGSVTVQSSVTDSGTTSGIREVAYFLDGVALGTATAAPYSLAWNTALYASGPRRLEALARDYSGNEGRAAIVVFVNNSGAPVIAQWVSSASYTAPFQTFTLSVRNDSPSAASDVTINAFWIEGLGSPAGLTRMYCNPTTGDPLPRNLGTLNPGQTVSLQLKCYVPADVTSWRRWVSAGTASVGGTSYSL